jgi:hypothetical protein
VTIQYFLTGDFYHPNLRYTAVISAVWALHAENHPTRMFQRTTQQHHFSYKEEIRKKLEEFLQHMLREVGRGGIKVSSHSVLVHHETLLRLRGGAFARFATPMA